MISDKDGGLLKEVKITASTGEVFELKDVGYFEIRVSTLCRVLTFSAPRYCNLKKEVTGSFLQVEIEYDKDALQREEMERQAAEQARLAAAQRAREEAEAKLRAEEEARLKAERERLAAEEKARKEAEAKAKAEEEARIKAEKARLADEVQARKEAEARAKAEEKARIKAEQTRLADEEKARKEAEAKAEEEARMKAEQERLTAEEQARKEAEAKVTKSGTAPDGAVNLGLSVFWATCNLDKKGFVSSPEKYGAHYAWGETATKMSYEGATYKWFDDDVKSLSKYNTGSSYGTVDDKMQLELSDDVAHQNLGGSWRMPTEEEWQELIDNCTVTWTTLKGVDGILFTSRKSGYTDQSIFLPAAGYMSGTSIRDAGFYGLYWSSSLRTGTPNLALYLRLASFGIMANCGANRFYGLSIRPVSE